MYKGHILIAILQYTIAIGIGQNPIQFALEDIIAVVSVDVLIVLVLAVVVCKLVLRIIIAASAVVSGLGHSMSVFNGSCVALRIVKSTVPPHAAAR